MRLTCIGFDADDTLWENEQFFRLTEARFGEFLSEFADPAHLSERLHAAEMRNLRHYGFGIKGFTLSMIETAIEVTEGRVPAMVLQQILDAGRELLSHPIELLPHARAAVEWAAGARKVVLVTKGDLFDQERKLAQSGLGDLFDGVEIVSDKTEATYARVFESHGDGPGRGMMVGNSLKSDVIPALAAGAWGVHVPHDLTWTYERVDPPPEQDRFATLADLGELPALVESIG